MVIGVVGWGSVRGSRGGDWRGRGAPPMKDSIDMFLVRESLGTGVAACGGIVNGFSSTIDLQDSFSSMPFIDSSERFCSFTLCLSPVPVMLIELLRDLEDRPWGLASPPWNGEPV